MAARVAEEDITGSSKKDQVRTFPIALGRGRGEPYARDQKFRSGYDQRRTLWAEIRSRVQVGWAKQVKERRPAYVLTA